MRQFYSRFTNQSVIMRLREWNNLTDRERNTLFLISVVDTFVPHSGQILNPLTNETIDIRSQNFSNLLQSYYETADEDMGNEMVNYLSTLNPDDIGDEVFNITRQRDQRIPPASRGNIVTLADITPEQQQETGQIIQMTGGRTAGRLRSRGSRS